MATKGEPTEEDWRELAKQAAEEKPPNKMIALVQKLIAKFNEGKLPKNPARLKDPRY
jgi:hypothetical protein